MKKNDYKACIDHISPDRHFKTRLKEKVLTSGHKVKKKQKKMERCGRFQPQHAQLYLSFALPALQISARQRAAVTGRVKQVPKVCISG